MGFQIAIDGPSGSGKSSLAKKLARELKYIYVDTGAMYRGIGYYCIKNNIPLDENDKIIEILDKINIKICYDNLNQHIYINNEDFTEFLRTQEAAKAASKVAAIKEVRNKLLDLQRELGEKNDVVMDGRDIGSFILKNANLKIYLDANQETRAIRRQNELEEKGIFEDLEIIKKEINERDYYDKNRKINPLIKTNDAKYLDTSDLSEEEVLKKILTLVKKISLN